MAEHYRIAWEELELEDDTIGKGSFGDVFKGCYVGTDVAVKRLPAITDEESQKYIMRELAVYLQLHHPNVVQLLGVSSYEGQIFLVMEFMHNGNLEQYIKNKKNEMGWKKKTKFALDIAKSIAFIHGKGILHRDIKSPNILISETDTCKVCDFGLSRQEDHEDFTKTQVGTPLWMAPELLKGCDYGQAADVYSFGLVLYEIITRKSPPERKLSKMLHFEIEPARDKIAMDCPFALYRIFEDCVKDDPDERPRAADVVKRLSALLKHLEFTEIKNIPKIVIPKKSKGSKKSASSSANTAKKARTPGGHSARKKETSTEVNRRNRQQTSKKTAPYTARKQRASTTASLPNSPVHRTQPNSVRASLAVSSDNVRLGSSSPLGDSTDTSEGSHIDDVISAWQQQYMQGTRIKNFQSKSPRRRSMGLNSDQAKKLQLIGSGLGGLPKSRSSEEGSAS